MGGKYKELPIGEKETLAVTCTNNSHHMDIASGRPSTNHMCPTSTNDQTPVSPSIGAGISLGMPLGGQILKPTTNTKLRKQKQQPTSCRNWKRRVWDEGMTSEPVTKSLEKKKRHS